jgi:hypothetical protein
MPEDGFLDSALAEIEHQAACSAAVMVTNGKVSPVPFRPSLSVLQDPSHTLVSCRIEQVGRRISV